MAALRQYDGQFRNECMRQVEAKARSPKTRLLAIFDGAEKGFKKTISMAACSSMWPESIPKKIPHSDMCASNLNV